MTTIEVKQSGHRKGRTVGIVGVLTVCVAVVGYLREAALAARFGISSTMDAYFAAIFIPNILYGVLIAGTLSPVFIPILMQEDPENRPEEASTTFSVITNFTLLVLIAIVAGCLAGAHKWLPLVFPGFTGTTDAVAVKLIYIIFPTLPLLATAGILSALLNGFHKFWLPAIAPAFASISVIAAAVFARGTQAVYAVGIATAVGFLVQFIMLVPATASLGIRYRPVLHFRHPGIQKLLRLGIPLFLYLAVANVSSVLERNLASRISAGAVSTLTYAFRLFTVPSNFLAAPLAIVAYPGFVREAVRAERGNLANQASRLFHIVVFLFLPVTAWTILNASPITRLLYEHGRFVASDSLITSRILAIYSIGIFPNALAVVLLRCFFAIEDTMTPLVIELLDLGLFLAVAPYLARHFGLEGLVAARCSTFFFVTALLVAFLVRKKLLRLDLEFCRFFALSALATSVMGALAWTFLRLTQDGFDAGNTLTRLAIVCTELLISAGTFLVAARLVRLPQAGQIVNTIRDLVPWVGDRNAQ